ncbi:aldehyde reductase 1 [Pyricularia oryzae 70-15]|uniref:Aldehyde reductase 1 n=1 Tax=Pyricularia oryzae (strain 70-15 / ATCC MYA-4617 / FGSC 8958) TaxID=242507 RepID=G4N2H6_PYRO7|nr:aldehyde reductase 1 [Pyricularia oryzae 70-15]EHA53381.1 aldehyde reductase 1 [Pyricularia oryzae 70-15]KAI7918615.1 aldehyde reductase 1 [Pyricularia oryzae]KAI7920403.1 aldehyde reductase 1 [Pyricularia oryzae]
MSSGRKIKLNSGHEIPVIGLGTWQSNPNEVAKAVEHALRNGYRHIDGALVYGNEHEVGEGIRASGVPRSDIFLTSKLWNTFHHPDDVEAGIDLTLRDLGTHYVDLYLIHWPVSFAPRENPRELFPIDPATGATHVVDIPDADTWRAMERLVESGKARSIGVSNFTRGRLEKLLQTARIRPAVNQIEAHPYLQQRELLEWHRQQGIVVQAYSPTGNNIYGRPKPLDDPVVLEVAARVGRTPAQVLVQWAAQRGTVVLPKSVTPSRIDENFVDFELPADEVEKLNALERHARYNFPARLGVDIFGEATEEELKAAVQAFIEQRRQA